MCYRTVNAQMEARKKSKKRYVFTASLSCKNIEKLNKVGIVSFNGKM